MPTQFTAPLQEDFVSDGPKLRRFVELFWKSKETPPGQRFTLDPWQEWLIDRVLERYPADWPVVELRGRLRYEQCVISMGRQNGKTILAAVLSLYGLTMHVSGPNVLGLAESVAQANLVYNVARFVIDNDERLANRFVSTGTRGIRSLDGKRSYTVKPGKADALQGITISFCLYDEVHLTPPDMWAAVVYGQSAVEDSMLLGITTAGDERSELLKQLYTNGAMATAGEAGLERFGWFLWEAPENAAIDDPAAIKAANPAIACGRKSLEKTLNAVRTTPEPEARQFIHNRFVASSGEAWLPQYMWAALPTGVLPVPPTHVAVAVTPDQSWGSVTVSAKVDGQVYTELAACLPEPDLDALTEVCQQLAAKHTVTFVVDGAQLRDLAMRLRSQGYPVEWFNQSGMKGVARTAYAKVARGEVTHDDAAIVTQQIGRGGRKTDGDSWRIVANGKADIDALMSTVMAIYAAETMAPVGPLVM